jgi:hypothetical protein
LLPDDLQLPLEKEVDAVDGVILSVDGGPSDVGLRLQVVGDREELPRLLNTSKQAIKTAEQIDSSVHLGLKILANEALVVFLGDYPEAYAVPLGIYGGRSGFLSDKS